MQRVYARSEVVRVPVNLEELKAAEAAATAGPWFFHPIMEMDDDSAMRRPTNLGWVSTNPKDGYLTVVERSWDGDALFIALMRNALPALIAEVEASRAERAEFFEKWPSGGWVDYESHRKVVAENEALRKALENYMSQFGQALDANGIAYGPAQQAADADARAALSPANVTHSQSTCPGVSKCSCFCHEWGGAHPGQKYTGSSEWDAADATHEQEASDD